MINLAMHTQDFDKCPASWTINISKCTKYIWPMRLLFSLALLCMATPSLVHSFHRAWGTRSLYMYFRFIVAYMPARSRTLWVEMRSNFHGVQCPGSYIAQWLSQYSPPYVVCRNNSEYTYTKNDLDGIPIAHSIHVTSQTLSTVHWDQSTCFGRHP